MSYREKQEARIAELEAENADLRAENEALKQLSDDAEGLATSPVPWLKECPMCGAGQRDGSNVPHNPLMHYKGYTYPTVCEHEHSFFFWRRCRLSGQKHLHQSCTCCNATWACADSGVVLNPIGY